MNLLPGGQHGPKGVGFHDEQFSEHVVECHDIVPQEILAHGLERPAADLRRRTVQEMQQLKARNIHLFCHTRNRLALCSLESQQSSGSRLNLHHLDPISLNTAPHSSDDTPSDNDFPNSVPSVHHGVHWSARHGRQRRIDRGATAGVPRPDATDWPAHPLRQSLQVFPTQIVTVTYTACQESGICRVCAGRAAQIAYHPVSRPIATPIGPPEDVRSTRSIRCPRGTTQRTSLPPRPDPHIVSSTPRSRSTVATVRSASFLIHSSREVLE